MRTLPTTAIADNDVIPADASMRLVERWLYKRSPHTIASYRRYASRFLDFVGKPLHLVELADIQAWQMTLSGLSPNSQRTAISAVRSLLTFGHRIGILPVNVAKGMRAPQSKNILNKRILSKREVQRMIDEEIEPRNQLILFCLYAGGLRVSELCQIKWKDLENHWEVGPMIWVFGKGGKERVLLVPDTVWDMITSLREEEAGADDPVFSSRQGDALGRHLDRTQVYRIVATAAKRAGIQGKVSPDWLRHARASHSLERATE